MLLYNVLIETAPDPSAPQDDPEGPPGGAFATCWVLAENPDAAVSTVTTAILDHRWIPGKVHHVRTVNVADVKPDDESTTYIAEAIECGCSIVMHTFPPEGQDEAPPADEPPST